MADSILDERITAAVPDALERPSWACLLQRTPEEGRSWHKADDGFKTCSLCYDRMRDRLKEVGRRYLLLDPRPGVSGEGSRGAPGFGSRSPASDHIIVMRDPRSSTDARTWLGRDKRLHLESERPPLSVHGVLATCAWDIAETRGVDGPDDRADVHGLLRYIDRHMDWLTRQEMVIEVDQALRDLVAQLKPVTGDPGRRHIGLCPNVIDEGETTKECEAKLYAPIKGDEIVCGSCGRVWPRSEWLNLGDMLESA